MAHTTFSKTDESSHQQIKKQDNCNKFFNSCRVVHNELVLPGVTVNQKYYLELLDCLRKGVMGVQIEIADD
jgi:hypothetical protein